MFTNLKTACLGLLLLAGTACTQTETHVEHTVTTNGDTLSSTTRSSTTATGIDTGTVEKAGERLQEVGAGVKQEVKESAREVKEEFKETRSQVKERVRDRDTIVVK